MSTTLESRDPVCGMKLNQSEIFITSNFDGNTYRFCSTDCKEKFDAAPYQYMHEVTIDAPTLEVDTAEKRCELSLVGMHCASCAGRIEKALGNAIGVTTANVNFATSRATVQYDPQTTNVASLSKVVRELGYDVITAISGKEHAGMEDLQTAETKVREDEYRQQKVRFIVALALTIPLAVLAMAGHVVPALENVLNFNGRPWLELALTTPVLFWAGRDFFTGAWAAARHRVADMNTLVSLGTLSAYLFSVVATSYSPVVVRQLN